MKDTSLLLVLALSLVACKKEGEVSPVPDTQGYAAVTGSFSIKTPSGSSYTVSSLQVKITAYQLTGADSYLRYTFRGTSSTGDKAQIQVSLTQPTPLPSANGPWQQQTSVYAANSSYTATTLVGSGEGTFGQSPAGYQAVFTGPTVSGYLTQ